MPQMQIAEPELPNLITFIADKFKCTPLAEYFYAWENVFFSFG